MTRVLFDLDLPGWAAQYAVVLLRMIGLFLFMPIFGSELLPLRVRLGAAAVLALTFLHLAPRPMLAGDDVAGWIVIATRELTVGLGLGLAARMLFAGVEAAASLLAGQSGFALANMIDPTSGDQALAPALFQNLMFIALFLAADLHHLMVRAIAGSYELLPPAAVLPATGGLGALTGLFGMRVFALAVELAAPALIVTVAVDLVLALVSRAMPQVPILLVGYPIKMAAGLIAMAMLATSTGAALGWIGRTFTSDGSAILAALAGR